jgi:membrane-associated phospholipid phosphatase
VTVPSLSPLSRLLVQVLASVVALLGVGGVVMVGPRRLLSVRRAGRRRIRAAAPYLGVLGGVLILNKLVRDTIPEVSWLIDLNVTSSIYALEGAFVADVQSYATPALTAYFGFVYIVGYVFLLVFPFVAYVSLDDQLPLRRAAIAYALNYSIGLVCYVLFVAYGPRNVIPDLVAPLLYETYPTTQLLTSEVNTNTNVFPSLHTSLSVSAALLAWQTRDRFRWWAVVAAVLAVSISVATMYLGIHWATDVVAGVVLGGGSVLLATRYTDRARDST